MPRYSEEEFLSKFWERVDKISDASGCWLWTGSKTLKGYGKVMWNGKICSTHRVTYLLAGHTIPDNLDLCHSGLCIGKKHCCNPDHLIPGTRAENCADKVRDGTDCRGEKHHSVKLTAQQVLEIRGRSTENQRKLAEEFGVKRVTISDIIRRKNWKHI
jgi:hypothetical protein